MFYHIFLQDSLYGECQKHGSSKQHVKGTDAVAKSQNKENWVINVRSKQKRTSLLFRR